MIKKIIYSAIVAVLMLSASVQAEIVNRIVAVVGNQVITMSDLEKAYTKDELGILKSGSQISKREYLEKMIEKMLIDQEVKRQGITVSVLEVEQAIEKKRTQLGMSPDDFIQTLRRQGMTIDEYRDQVRENLVLGKLVSREVKSEINISDKEIELYYQKHQAEFKTPDKIHLYHLVIRKADASRETIARIQKEFAQGASFTALAKKYSEGEEAEKGGDLGWVEMNALKPELAQMLMSVEINELSPVYEDEVGLHLFWIQGREKGIQPGLDQVKAQIKQILEREQFDQQYELWLKRLKGKAYIEIRL